MKTNLLVKDRTLYSRNGNLQYIPFNSDDYFKDLPSNEGDNFRASMSKIGLLSCPPTYHADAGFSKAVAKYLIGEVKNPVGFGGVAKTEDGKLYCEYIDESAKKVNPLVESAGGFEKVTWSKSPRICMTIDKNFNVEGVVIDEYGARSQYIIRDSRTAPASAHSSSAYLYAVLANIVHQYQHTASCLSDAFFSPLNTAEAILRKGSSDTLSDEELNDLEDAFAMISANLYTVTAYPEQTAVFLSRFGCDWRFEPQKLTSTAVPMLDLSTVKIDRLYFGSMAPKAEEKKKASNKSSKITLADLKGMYDPDPEREYTEEEKKLFFNPPSFWDIPDKLEFACQLYKASYSRRKKMNKFLLCGVAGVGKSSWAELFSYAIHKPLVTFSAAKQMDVSDLTQTIVPVDSSSNEEGIQDLNELPSFDDIVFDPAGSYFKLTGKNKDDATSSDCQVAYTDVVLNMLSKQISGSEKSSSKFKYVKSSLIKAYENGWVVEVQEPTLLKPDVLAGLNSMFDGTEQVTLIDGTVVKPHKDFAIIMTTNLSYEGCNTFNQSVLDRFSMIDLGLPTDTQMVERIRKNAEFDDVPTITKMVKVYHDCEKYAESQDIYDGVISERGLIEWAAATAINGLVYDDGVEFFINKCSLDRDTRAEFMNCLESQFSEGETVNSID